MISFKARTIEAVECYERRLRDTEWEFVRTLMMEVDDRAPSWEQYKYLFGHVYHIVVEDTCGKVTKGELLELHHQMMVKHNPKKVYLRDGITGKVVVAEDGEKMEALVPGSVSLDSGISMRKLSKITESVKVEFEQLGYVFDTIEGWDGDVDPELVPEFIWGK